MGYNLLMPEIFDAEQGKNNMKKKVVRVSVDDSNIGDRHHALSSFLKRPKNIRFSTQEINEEIILLMRQHPVVNVPWVVILALLVSAPAAVDFLPGWSILPPQFQMMTLVLWYLFISAYALMNFLNWYFNVYIVTDERVVDIDFYGLNYRDIAIAKIGNIEDVNMMQPGSLSAIFDYGDVMIQTAGETQEFDFLKVPHPAKVVEVIYQLMEKEK
jgi:membrane protein YdbS with pleckstrin-like domain